jgi:hypothetical protein
VTMSTSRQRGKGACRLLVTIVKRQKCRDAAKNRRVISPAKLNTEGSRVECIRRINKILRKMTEHDNGLLPRFDHVGRAKGQDGE